MHSSLKAH